MENRYRHLDNTRDTRQHATFFGPSCAGVESRKHGIRGWGASRRENKRDGKRDKSRGSEKSIESGKEGKRREWELYSVIYHARRGSPIVSSSHLCYSFLSFISSFLLWLSYLSTFYPRPQTVAIQAPRPRAHCRDQEGLVTNVPLSLFSALLPRPLGPHHITPREA